MIQDSDTPKISLKIWHIGGFPRTPWYRNNKGDRFKLTYELRRGGLLSLPASVRRVTVRGRGAIKEMLGDHYHDPRISGCLVPKAFNSTQPPRTDDNLVTKREYAREDFGS